jgi:hypothetical protein
MGVYDVMRQGNTSALPFGAPFPQILRHSESGGANMDSKGVAVVMAHTPDVDCYGGLAAQINRMYCDRHQYKFRLVVGEPLDKQHWVTWDKIKHLRNVLDDSSVEWAFWIDSDAIFNMQRVGLDIFAVEGADMCICADIPWRLGTNTGTMLIKNTQWARDFLDAWWARANGSKFANVKAHEQTELDRMLSEDVMGCRTGNKVALFPATAFNGAHWLPNPHERFVLHYMARDKEFRTRVLSSRLCSLKILDKIKKTAK